MKKLILCLIILLFAYPLYAAPRRWCQWDGTAGYGCQTENDGVILDTNGNELTTLQAAHAAGFYRVVKSQPILGTNQIKDEVQQSFSNNEIIITWSVRDLTQDEIDTRDAAAMDVTDYVIFKLIIGGGVFTLQQLQTLLQDDYPEIINAYQARSRLENP